MNSVFEKNVQNSLGEAGLTWIHSLPTTIKKLSNHWLLTHVEPAKNMSWNYVAYAIQNNKDQVVLKISFDHEMIKNEYRALKYFDGHGAIKVIARNEEFQAMLLEQAVPGNSLKENYPIDAEKIIISYAQVVKKIASSKLPASGYPHMSTWCEAIDQIQDNRIDKQYVHKAKQLKFSLLNSVKNEYLCHGDLHLENIIQNGNDWLAIDPKGIMGEMAFEAAAFDLLDNDELNDLLKIELNIVSRVTQLSTALDIDPNRLLQWIFLRIIIAAQWFVEDNGDPSRMLKLAQHVYPLLKE